MDDTVSVPGSFVRFTGEDGFIYTGMLFTPKSIPATRAKTIVIHSHGTFGNFYHNSFLDVFAEVYSSRGFSFLTFNHRCHDGLAEGYFVDDHLEYVGTAASPFDSCLQDFSTVIGFLRRMGYERFILQGHSLGCERAVHYRLNNQPDIELILLSPVNSRLTQELWAEEILGMTVTELVSALEEGRSNDLSYRVYGSTSKTAGWSYPIPIYEQVFLKFLKSAAIDYFNPSGSTILQLGGCLVVLTTQDEFNFGRFDTQRMFFQALCLNDGQCSEFQCGHDYRSHEVEVANVCANWITSRTLQTR